MDHVTFGWQLLLMRVSLMTFSHSPARELKLVLHVLFVFPTNLAYGVIPYLCMYIKTVYV